MMLKNKYCEYRPLTVMYDLVLTLLSSWYNKLQATFGEDIDWHHLLLKHMHHWTQITLSHIFTHSSKWYYFISSLYERWNPINELIRSLDFLLTTSLPWYRKIYFLLVMIIILLHFLFILNIIITMRSHVTIVKPGYWRYIRLVYILEHTRYLHHYKSH
jgi:hypothetical protein